MGMRVMKYYAPEKQASSRLAQIWECKQALMHALPQSHSGNFVERILLGLCAWLCMRCKAAGSVQEHQNEKCALEMGVGPSRRG